MDRRGQQIRENVDRISELSDDVLVIILMKIPLEEAARTSLLSKRWMNVWKQIYDM